MPIILPFLHLSLQLTFERVVGWTNEENGGRGGKAYAKAHGNETIFAIESDGGSSTPTGIKKEKKIEEKFTCIMVFKLILANSLFQISID